MRYEYWRFNMNNSTTTKQEMMKISCKVNAFALNGQKEGKPLNWKYFFFTLTDVPSRNFVYSSIKFITATIRIKWFNLNVTKISYNLLGN